MQITAIIYTALCIFTIFFPQTYFSELYISFLPYHIAILFLVLCIFIYKTKKSLSSNQKIEKKWIFLITTLIIATTFFLYSREFRLFYETPDKTINIINQSGLKILYANIHKNNKNYDELKNTIQKENPDLIMFVEFSENHYNHLKGFLKDNYPYINSTTRSEKFIGSMVFSKIPITNRADDFPQGARRYAYFHTKYNKKDYYIYLIHTSSPDDYSHFQMRNNQLETLGKDLQKQGKYRESENIIIIGDFNLSPRSVYYKSFEEKYLNGFYNQTRKLPFLFTWTFKQLPIFKSQIDQLWTTEKVKIINLKSISIHGSDHKGFVGEIID